MTLVLPKEFVPNNCDGYEYGMFHQEVGCRYYISDETIDGIISKIDWELNANERAYLIQWRRFEKIHRDYCLGLMPVEEYRQSIAHEYGRYADQSASDFGEGCDELTNHIIRYLK